MHNCGTCAHGNDSDIRGHWKCGLDKEFCNDHEFMMATEPQNMRPCVHGQPVVASAVARVEFGPRGDYAYHRHYDLYCYEWFKDYTGLWELDKRDEDNDKLFCETCGNRLATSAELSQMYAAHKADQAGREKQG